MGADTKTMLLDSAETAVRTRGYDAFSYADLAHDVGIKKASIHYHFPTKANLSVALIKRYKGIVEQALNKIEAREISGAEKIIALVEFYREATKGGRCLCLCVALSVSYTSLTPRANTEINDFHTMMMNWIANIFRQCIRESTVSGDADPKSEAAATLSLLEGAQLATRTAQDLSAFDRATDSLKFRFQKR